MNLVAARVTLRERPLADVLDLALPLCLANIRPLVVLAAVALAPIGALAGWLRLAQGWSWPALWLLVLEASFATEGLFTLAFGELMFQSPAEVRAGALVRTWGGRFPSFVFALLARQVRLAVSAVLVFVPFLAAPSSLFVGEVVLLERAPHGKSWGRSSALAAGHRGFALGLWFATLALPAIGAIVVDQIGNAALGFGLQLGRPTGDLFHDGGSGLAVAGALMAAPIAAAARYLGYISLRTRKEGWDIQIRFMALAAGRPATGRRAA
jgi:hypothetical protein